MRSAPSRRCSSRGRWIACRNATVGHPLIAAIFARVPGEEDPVVALAAVVVRVGGPVEDGLAEADRVVVGRRRTGRD
jgi:hypothetical protein